MDVPQLFEVQPVADPDQQPEDVASQVLLVDPNKELVEAPQFFEVGSAPDPEQQPEDEVPQVSMIDLEPEVQEEQEKRVPQDSQRGLKPEMEEERAVLQPVQGGIVPEVEEKQEVLQDVQGGPEPDVEEEEEVLQALQGHSHLEINRMVDPEEVQQEYEASVARIQLRQDIEQNIQQELVHLTDNNILQENKGHLNIVPMASELLRPSWEEDRSEILQTRFRIANITDVIDITRQEFTLHQRIHRAPLEYITSLFRMQLGTYGLLLVEAPIPLISLESLATFLSVEGPPRLLALEAQPRLLALEGPPRSLPLEAPPRFSALECPPLLSALECQSLLPSLVGRPLLPSLVGRPLLPSLVGRPLLPTLVGRLLLPALDDRPLLPFSEVHASFSEETEMYSGLQERGPSERVSVCTCEPAEVMAVRPQNTKEHKEKKPQQRADPFDPVQPNATLVSEVLQDVEHGNQDVSDPGVPEFSDPRELLKDLNFGEMKAAALEMEHIGDLDMKSIEEIETEIDGALATDPDEALATDPDEALETDPDGALETDPDEALETKPKGDLETEECLPLFPPECQRPNEVIIEIPEEPVEVAPNAELPNDGGNRPFNHNGRCRDGEADMESRERQLDEAYPEEMTTFVALLFLGLLVFLCIGQTLNVLSYELGWRGNRTLDESTPLTDMIFNVTSPMTTTNFNVTSSDFNATASMHDLS